ncbi:hypothetical protein MMC31_003898 [Peltigera leucophlebia]|nr:hypothetical protein [Peltigera leucophlebia]
MEARREDVISGEADCIESDEKDHKPLIRKLIFALQEPPAASIPQSRNGNETLFDDLDSLSSRIVLHDFIPLLQHVFNGSPDLDIRDQIFALTMSSISDSEIIARDPIREGLCSIKQSISDSLDGSSRVEDLKLSLISKLIIALQELPAASILPSRNGNETLGDDLESVLSRMASHNFTPLLQHVLNGSPDLDIWDQVFILVENNLSPKPTTPPKVSSSVNYSTPFKSNAGSQRGDEQKHGDIDRMLEEIRDCMYKDTKGFYEKYFEGTPWSAKAEKIVKDANPRKTNNRWSGYPYPPPDESDFLKWLGDFQRKYFQGHRGKYCQSKDVALGGSDCQRKPDLFLALPTNSSKKYEWPDVRVIGELKITENTRNYKEELVRFSELAREVFISQPTRLFLHGIIIRGPTVELLVFDRSGPYSCGKFNLYNEPEKFIKIIAGYTLMGDNELGLDTYIIPDASDRYIRFKGEGMTGEEKIYLESQPIAFQHSMVCRGTTCYRAKRPGSKAWEFVAKFSWQSNLRQAEGKLLKLAKERGVWGVAQLYGYQELNRISTLRLGMEFENQMTFTSGSISHPQSKTKSDRSKNTSSKSTNPSRRLTDLTSGSLSLGQEKEQNMKLEVPYRSERPNPPAQASWEQDDVSESAWKRPARETQPYENRIFSCLVVFPPGRAIHKFKSVFELLEAFRDFIKGHKSLIQKGNILHRDISVNNLIITDAKDENGPKGMLIDLDLAQELDQGSGRARHRTGTMEFMAIEVLSGPVTHTYRHDLESFFYVFLWVVIGSGQEGLPRNSRLRSWYRGTYTDIATTKRGHMTQLDDIVAEFPRRFENVKELAKELRDILFGTEGGGPFVRTYEGDKERNKMYDGMINAFNKAIEKNWKVGG